MATTEPCRRRRGSPHPASRRASLPAWRPQRCHPDGRRPPPGEDRVELTSAWSQQNAPTWRQRTDESRDRGHPRHRASGRRRGAERARISRTRCGRSARACPTRRTTGSPRSPKPGGLANACSLGLTPSTPVTRRGRRTARRPEPAEEAHVGREGVAQSVPVGRRRGRDPSRDLVVLSTGRPAGRRLTAPRGWQPKLTVGRPSG